MLSDAIVSTLRHAWQALEPQGVPMAVLGGMALARWKRVRATRDVDLLIAVDAGKRDAVLECLTAAGFRRKHDHTFIDLGDVILLQMLYEPPDLLLDIQLDVQIANAPYQRQLLARAVPFDLPDGPTMKAVACEDLVLLKLLAGRVIDRVDAAALLRANADDIDIDYLLHWAKELKLTDALREIWAEALADRPWPGGE